jgi:hypothetical protein
MRVLQAACVAYEAGYAVVYAERVDVEDARPAGRMRSVCGSVCGYAVEDEAGVSQLKSVRALLKRMRYASVCNACKRLHSTNMRPRTTTFPVPIPSARTTIYVLILLYIPLDDEDGGSIRQHTSAHVSIRQHIYTA